MLDIPPWWDHREYYKATLGHKINNKFEPFINAKFGAMELPRFGPIQIIWAARDISDGEELFLDYGYSKDFKNVLYPWHQEQFLKHK